MRHIISQEHHMEEGTPSDEEYITERSEDEEVTHFMDDVEHHQRLADCCMKTTVKKIINYVVYKPLTYIETILLCVYQFMLMWTLMAIAMEYNMVEFCLTWVLDDILRKEYIVLCAMVINCMIVVELCDDILQLICVFSCKCKKD